MVSEMAAKSPTQTLEQILAELTDDQLQAQIDALDQGIQRYQVLREAARALLEARRALDQTTVLGAIRQRKPSAAEAVLRIMGESPEREWTSEDILRELIARGWASSGKTPKNSTDATLSRLVQKKQVQRVARGVYRLPAAAQTLQPEPVLDFPSTAAADDDIPF